MSYRATIAIAVGLAALAGCQEPEGPVRPQGPPEPVAQVDQVHLWAPLQPTVKTGGGPGADAVQIEVYFEQAGQTMPVTVLGTLEVLMFAGRVQGEDLGTATPLQTWSFTASELRERLNRGRYGMFGYRLILPWDRRPTGQMITLTARYIPPQGPVVVSSPISVAIGPI